MLGIVSGGYSFADNLYCFVAHQDILPWVKNNLKDGNNQVRLTSTQPTTSATLSTRTSTPSTTVSSPYNPRPRPTSPTSRTSTPPTNVSSPYNPTPRPTSTPSINSGLKSIQTAIIVTGGRPRAARQSAEILHANGTSWCSLPSLPSEIYDHTQNGLVACGGFQHYFSSGSKSCLKLSKSGKWEKFGKDFMYGRCSVGYR